MGREQKGSICSNLNRADSSSIVVCEFLRGEKTQRLENLFMPAAKGRTRRKSQKPGSETLANKMHIFHRGDN